jgi:hypothetical protein
MLVGSTWANNQYFNPRQVGGLRLWLDATDPAGNGTQPANASSVSSWVDKSGNGNTVTQATGANQPTYRTNVLNGKPVVRFDGVNDLMGKSSASSLGTTVTMFVVGTTNGNASTRGTFFDYSTGAATNTGANIVQRDAGPDMTVGFFDGTLDQFSSGAIALPYTAVMYCYNTGSDGFLFLNGTQAATGATGNISGAPNAYTIGSLFNGVASWFLNGDVAEVIFYNGNISTAQKLLVNRYLGNKWGIAVA